MTDRQTREQMLNELRNDKADTAREIAKGLTKADRSTILALVGNSWTGKGSKSPELKRMLDLGLMKTIDLGTKYKVFSTELGLEVCAILKGQNDDQ